MMKRSNRSVCVCVCVCVCVDGKKAVDRIIKQTFLLEGSTKRNCAGQPTGRGRDESPWSKEHRPSTDGEKLKNFSAVLGGPLLSPPGMACPPLLEASLTQWGLGVRVSPEKLSQDVPANTSSEQEEDGTLVPRSFSYQHAATYLQWPRTVSQAPTGCQSG